MTFKSWRRVATWTTRLLLLAVLGLIAFAIVVLTVLPRATHGVAMTVLTGSMTPGIPVGSVVIDRPVDPGTLHVGDIATYQKEPGKAEYITHRIVKIDTSRSPVMFTFKGDANRGADVNPVPATAIRGKVWFHVPYLGALRDTLHTKGGLAGVAMLALAGYAIYQGTAAIRDRQRKLDTNEVSDQVHEPTRIVVEIAEPQFSMLMTVRRDAFAGLSPVQASRALGATLLEEHADTFTLVMTRFDRARDALELIDAVSDPIRDEYVPNQSAYVPSLVAI